MAWDKGFDFRNTSAYVTDPADHTYVLHTETYPTTRNGVTFGWSAGTIDSRDRDSGIDARLAGINFGAATGTFRVDLPATGDYDVRIASGDASFAQSGQAPSVVD